MTAIVKSDYPTLSVTIKEEHSGWRADRALSALTEAVPRREAKLLFKARLVRLNGRIASASDPVSPGGVLEFPDPAAAEQPEGSPFTATEKSAPRLTTPHGRHLSRLFEDEHLLVISKPAEIPVQRGTGGYTRRDTIEDVMYEAYPPHGNSEDEQGFWFVHRLDMETSGCLMMAKTIEARDALLNDFTSRRIHKEYLAVVVGEVEWKKLTVDSPIKYVRAEDPVAPKPSLRPWERTVAHSKKKGPPPMRGLKKGVITEPEDPAGKESMTHFQVVSRFRGYTLVRAEPKTGRTHQIRVHSSSAGHPLAYDPLYGRRSPLRMREFDLPSSETPAGEAVVLNRLPLHAWKLGFTHPVTKNFVRVQADLPRDLKEFVRILKRFRQLEEQTGRR